MAVTSEVSEVDYTGNGSTVAFAVPFRFIAREDLRVQKKPSGGAYSTLTLGVDYTVSGAGEDAGGTVTCTVAPAVASTLHIERTVPITQEVAFRTFGPFSPGTHEDSFDYGTMVDQQLDRRLAVVEALGAGITDDTIIGAGLVKTGDTLDVGGGFGIIVTADEVSVDPSVVGPYINVTAFGATGDGVTDDTAAILAAIDSVPRNAGVWSGTTSWGATIWFPPGVYRVSAQIDIYNRQGITLKGAGKTATIIRPFEADTDASWDVIRLTNAPFCSVQDMSIIGYDCRAGIALINDFGEDNDFGAGTQSTFRNVAIGFDANHPAGDYGWYVGGATDGNNDFHSFYDCRVHTSREASFAAVNSQAFDCIFVNCWFYDSKYAVRGPGWTWIGGTASLNSEADFESGLSPCRIVGGNSEGSARLLVTAPSIGNISPVTIDGFRWSLDVDAAVDDEMIVYDSAGPLAIRGCRFDTSLGGGRVSKIALSSIREMTLDIRSNVWNQEGADLVNCVTYTASFGGFGYPGGVFRGVENNLFAGASGGTGGYWPGVDGARTENAVLSAVPDKGYWKVGERFYYAAPTSGGYIGGVCTVEGQAAPPWVPLTAYTGSANRANGGKVYENTTPGTSAAAGGPTGTGTGIVDDTAIWKYVNQEAQFEDWGLIT